MITSIHIILSPLSICCKNIWRWNRLNLPTHTLPKPAPSWNHMLHLHHVNKMPINFPRQWRLWSALLSQAVPSPNSTPRDKPHPWLYGFAHIMSVTLFLPAPWRANTQRSFRHSVIYLVLLCISIAVFLYIWVVGPSHDLSFSCLLWEVRKSTGANPPLTVVHFPTTTTKQGFETTSWCQW